MSVFRMARANSELTPAGCLPLRSPRMNLFRCAWNYFCKTRSHNQAGKGMFLFDHVGFEMNLCRYARSQLFVCSFSEKRPIIFGVLASLSEQNNHGSSTAMRAMLLLGQLEERSWQPFHDNPL